MEEKLFNLVRIIKKETSGYEGVKKINFKLKYQCLLSKLKDTNKTIFY